MPEQSLLLVEDDEALREIVARHLRARGWSVAEAPSAEDAAVRRASGFRPAVVLLDINLPGDTGWDFLRTGPLAGPGTPPVVVVTATTIGPRRLREFGAAGYLPKSPTTRRTSGPTWCASKAMSWPGPWRASSRRGGRPTS